MENSNIYFTLNLIDLNEQYVNGYYATNRCVPANNNIIIYYYTFGSAF